MALCTELLGTRQKGWCFSCCFGGFSSVVFWGFYPKIYLKIFKKIKELYAVEILCIYSCRLQDICCECSHHLLLCVVFYMVFCMVLQVNGIAFHPVHGTLATVGSDGRFSFWDKDARTKLKTSEQLDQPISACCFNHNGNIFAYASSYDWSKVRKV